jgi:hypothetical protein
VRTIASVLALTLLLSGCAPAAKPEPPRPAAAIRQAHPGVTDGDISSQLNVHLPSGEPTGTAPFAVLAAMVESDPGLSVYSVTYTTLRGPNRVSNNYSWNVAEQTVGWTREPSEGPSTVIAPGRAAASGIDTDTLLGIAAGTRPVPPFRSIDTPNS